MFELLHGKGFLALVVFFADGADVCCVDLAGLVVPGGADKTQDLCDVFIGKIFVRADAGHVAVDLRRLI